MRGVNRICLVGNVGRDPESRFTQGGTAVCNFSLAVGERIKNGDQWVDATTWFSIVAFGKLAESAGNHLNKGVPVYIEGRVVNREWTDKEGQKRRSTEVIVSDMVFLGGKKEGRPEAPAEPFDDDSSVPF